MKITFLLSSLSQPRCWKRISFFHQLGLDCQVVGFKRNDLKIPEYHDVPVTILASVHIGNYLKRAWVLLSSLGGYPNSSSDGIFYAFGPDMLLSLLMHVRFRKRSATIVYEIGDVQDIYWQRGLVGTCARWLEKQLVRYADMVVITSPAYFQQFYHKYNIAPESKFFTIENKVAEDVAHRNHRNSACEMRTLSARIRIGYVGRLRDRLQFELLKELAYRTQDHFEFIVRGELSIVNFSVDEFRDLPNVSFGGPYRNPDDLSLVYSEFDLIWGVMNTNQANNKVLLANRLYEACFFRKPLMVSADTECAQFVAKHQIGLSIPFDQPGKAIDKILAITHEEIDCWVQNIELMDKSVYTLSYEHDQLYQRISQFRASL